VLPTTPYIPPDISYQFKVPEFEIALRRDAEKQLGRIARRYFEGQKVLRVVRQGVADEEILKVAQRQHVSLIVMATHGRTGIEHTLMGSVAEKVVRKARCPVLTVKPRGK
jgi:nucleotide-binding universal stress UspA family protein